MYQMDRTIHRLNKFGWRNNGWTSLSFWYSSLGPVSRKSRELFRPEKLVVKLQSACFEKLFFFNVFLREPKFDDLELLLCQDLKGIVAPK